MLVELKTRTNQEFKRLNCQKNNEPSNHDPRRGFLPTNKYDKAHRAVKDRIQKLEDINNQIWGSFILNFRDSSSDNLEDSLLYTIGVIF